MSLPKEPRQKMINIMYLVLTALLALNVSAEILNAFKTVDHSLMTASGIAEKKNQDVFGSFERKKRDPVTKEKAEYWMPKAQLAREYADAAYDYIEKIKTELKTESDLRTVDGKQEYKEDDLEASTRLFISTPPEGKGKAKELFNKLQSFKTDLLKINDTITREVSLGLPLDLRIPKTEIIPATDAQKTDWGYGYFHMTPTIASITILSKFQNDIRNSEAQVVEACHKKIGEVEIIYDQFKAMAQPSTQYAMPGEEIVITAGIGSFSKVAQPVINIDGASVPLNADGAAEYKITAGNPGIYSRKVRITYTRPDKKQETIEKEVKYTVGVPSGLVVSTDKTRVFYQDLPNELSVTGGSGDEKVTVNVEGPGVTVNKSGPGLYIISCPRPGTAIVTATDGKHTQKITIPIKRVPLPVATVAGKSGGGDGPPMGANVMRVQKGVAAELKDFIFEGVKYEVVSFTLYCTGKGFEENPGIVPVVGPYFSPEAITVLRKCQAGTAVMIDEIKVKGPGGIRTLDQNITFILQ